MFALSKYVDDLDDISCTACGLCQDHVDRITHTVKSEKQEGAKFLDMDRRLVTRRGEQKPRMLISPTVKSDETLDGESAVWKTAGSAPW